MKKGIIFLNLALVTCLSFSQWQLVEPLPDGWGGLYGIQFINNDIGYVSGYKGVGKSIDGGDTWTFNTEHMGSFTKLKFLNEDTGMVCCHPLEGHEVMMTLDGGETWEFPDVAPFYFAPTDFAFLPSGKTVIADCDAGGIVFVHSIDNYYTEYAGTNTMLGGLYCYDMQFLDEDTGYISGLFDDTGTGGSVTIRTVDGGETWTEGTSVFGPDIEISFSSPRVGYGYTNYYFLWKTEDYAETWVPLDWEFNEDVPGFRFAKVYFYNDTVGFVITEFGEPDNYEVLRTTNGGMSWDTTFFETDEFDDTQFIDLFCINEDVCFLTSTAGIFKTTNGAGYPVLPLEVEENGSFSLTLHPNPATDQLILEGLASYPDAVWNTYSISGQAIPLDLRKGQADISHLPPGIYLTTVQTHQGIWREKWVKL